FDRRFERRVAPLVERIGGLDVVVPVEEDRRPVGTGARPLGVDQRVTGGGDLLGGEPGRAELLDQPVGTAVDVAGVGGVGRDRRDPQVVEQLVEITGLVAIDAGEDVRTGVRHGSLTSISPSRAGPVSIAKGPARRPARVGAPRRPGWYP